MSRRPVRDLSVGAVATLGLVIFAMAVMAVGGQSRVFRSRAVYHLLFRDASGLREGSPVKMAGVQVGTVERIRLPADPGIEGIEVEVGVEKTHAGRLRDGTVAHLRYLQWVSGEKYVEISTGDPARPLLPDGSEIRVAEEPQIFKQGADIADNLTEITLSLKAVLARMQSGEGFVGQILNDPQFGKESLEHVQATLQNLDAITGRLRRGEGFAGKALTDPAFAATLDELARSVAGLSAFTHRLANHEGALGAILDPGGTAEQAIADLRDAAASLRRTTARLEARDGLFGRLLNDSEYSERVAADLRDSLRALAAITAKIDSGQGTLGALVNDRTLHDGMEEIVAGVGDSSYARWLARHYQKKGIKAQETPASPPK